DRPPEPIVLKPGDYVAVNPPKPAVRKPEPRKPAPPAPAKPARRPVVEEPELEVVDDEPPRATSKARRKPPADEDPGFEEVEDEEPRAKARRSRRDEDDEDDEPQPRKRRRKRRKSSLGLEGAAGLLLLLAPVVIWGLLVAIGFVVPKIAYLAMWFAVAVVILGRLWFLGVAFNEDQMQGTLCIWVPFYDIVFLVSHFEDAWKPFVLGWVG